MARHPISRRAALAGAATLPFALSGRAGAAANAPGGVLKYATLGLDASDPHRHTGALGVQQAYVEGLTSIAANGAVEPFLAEAFEVSPDGRTYTLRLRHGVRFHNGDAMAAADVVANMERVKTKVRGGWLTSAMRQAEGFQAVDDHTVVIHLKKPYAPLLNLLSEMWILSPKSPGWEETISLPIGTGPFSFGEWQPKVRFRAPAFAGYWQQGRPYLSAVEFDLRDEADHGLALRAGDLHVASVTRDKLRPMLRDPALKVQAIKDTTWYFTAFNNRSPRAPFDDIRVRQAIAYAIDKRAVMNFVAGQDAIVTNQMVIPGNLYFDQATHDSDAHARPNLDRARALLREAGVDPSKRRLEVISWQSAYPQVIIQMIKRLGFEVNHVALDDVGAQRRLGRYDWDLALFESGPRADVFLRYVRLMSDGPNPVLWGGIQDQELDALIDRAVAEADQARRKEAYLAAFRRVMEKYYFVVLGHEQHRPRASGPGRPSDRARDRPGTKSPGRLGRPSHIAGATDPDRVPEPVFLPQPPADGRRGALRAPHGPGRPRLRATRPLRGHPDRGRAHGRASVVENDHSRALLHNPSRRRVPPRSTPAVALKVGALRYRS